MKYKVGFIGTGNMGGALAGAIAKSVGKENVALYDLNTKSAEKLAESIGATSVELGELVGESRFIFLGVKPNVMESVCTNIKDILSDKTTVVSMGAGVSIASLEKWLNHKNIIRIMPNTPVAVSSGMVLYSINSKEPDEQEFLSIMQNCGVLDKLDEKLIDAGAALSGCGPAFAYVFIEALADGAVACGLPRAKAELYAKQTVLGAATLVTKTGKHTGVLKDEVCSPGGTTIEGVLALEEGSFRHAAASAVRASYEKTAKLLKK